MPCLHTSFTLAAGSTKLTTTSCSGVLLVNTGSSTFGARHQLTRRLPLSVVRSNYFRSGDVPALGDGNRVVGEQRLSRPGARHLAGWSARPRLPSVPPSFPTTGGGVWRSRSAAISGAGHLPRVVERRSSTSLSVGVSLPLTLSRPQLMAPSAAADRSSGSVEASLAWRRVCFAIAILTAVVVISKIIAIRVIVVVVDVMMSFPFLND